MKIINNFTSFPVIKTYKKISQVYKMLNFVIKTQYTRCINIKYNVNLLSDNHNLYNLHTKYKRPYYLLILRYNRNIMTQ